MHLFVVSAAPVLHYSFTNVYMETFKNFLFSFRFSCIIYSQMDGVRPLIKKEEKKIVRTLMLHNQAHNIVC